MQNSLIPVYCTKTKPPPQTADADCIAVCASTGFPYLCKSTKLQPLLPAREWICSHLAKACGLPVPNCALITIAGRSDVLFGSAWEPGTIDVTQAIMHVSNPNIFFKTLSFDFATQNGDRHLKNYVYLNVDGEILIKLIDFSRALNFEGWPMPSLPLSNGCNTELGFQYWSLIYGFDRSEAEKIVDIWNALPNDIMKNIVEPMPDEWMSEADRLYLIQWWSSPNRVLRGNEVRNHLP